MARMPSDLGYRQTPRAGGVRMPVLDQSSGLNAVGAALNFVAEVETEKRERQQAEDEAVQVAAASTRYRARHTERLISEGDALTDEAVDGFTERYTGGLDEDLEAEVSALPERVRARARLQFQDERERLRLRGLEVEHGRRVERQGRLLDDQLRSSGAVVFHDPTAYAETLDAARATIEASGIPEAAQAEALSRLPSVLAEQRMLGLVDRDPGLALRELNGGEWDGDLDVEKIARYRDAAQAELDRRRAENERRQRMALERARASMEVRMQDDLASIRATGRGVGVQLSQIERIYGGEAADAYMAQRREAEGDHQLLSRWRYASPAEIAEDLAQMAPRAGQDGFVAAAERHQRYAQVAEAVNAQRAEDPAQAALAADPTLNQLWEGLAAQETNAASRRVIIAQMRDRQDRLGIARGDQRLVTNAQAQAFAARITSAEPAARAAALQDVSNDLGALYGADAPRALAEVARVAEMPALGAMAAVGSERDRTRVARALGGPEPALPAAQARRLNSQLDTSLRPLRESLAVIPGGLDRYAQAREAAARVAAVDVAAGVDPGDAARNAAAIYTQSYQFRDGLRLPRTWNGQPLNADRVARGARARIGEIAAGDSFRLPAGATQGVRGADQAAAARDAFRATARWITHPDDQRLILVDEFGDAIAGPDGAPITASWDELQAAPAPAPSLPINPAARAGGGW